MAAPCPFCAFVTGHHSTCLARPNPSTLLNLPCPSGTPGCGCQAPLSPPQPRHDGPDLLPSDHSRLSTQQDRVRALMSDGAWWTLAALAERVGASEAGVSARIRDLRKPRFGGYRVERKRDGALHLYRLAKSSNETAVPDQGTAA